MCFVHPQPSLRNKFRWRDWEYADLYRSPHIGGPVVEEPVKNDELLQQLDERETTAPTEAEDEPTITEPVG